MNMDENVVSTGGINSRKSLTFIIHPKTLLLSSFNAFDAIPTFNSEIPLGR